MECKKCGGAHTVKNGILRGKQRYKCKTCGYNFVAGDARQKVSAEGKALAVLLYARGKASFGFIAKLLNVTPAAVMKWMKKVSEKLPSPEINDSIHEVEFDEMWHFINKKKQSCGYGGRWTAFEVRPSAGLLAIVLLQHSVNFSKGSKD
jgi:transposase